MEINNLKKYISVLILILSASAVFAFGGTGFNTYRKYYIPPEYDPNFITNLEDCKASEFVDWYGTHKYIIIGRDEKMNACHYKSQYNPWLKIKRNEWFDYKECFFNDTQIRELTTALKEEGYINGKIVGTYNIGAYKVTGTKVEYLLSSYEYYGACKLLKKDIKF